MQDTFDRATHSAYAAIAAGRPSAAIGYLVYKKDGGVTRHLHNNLSCARGLS